MSNPTLRLSICGGPHNGETFESNNDEVLIGRGLVNRSQEITFENDDEVSSVHFVLQFKFNGRGRNKWSVRDLNSSNGTYVNGKRLQGGNQRILRGKDVVHFGRSEAKYHGGRHPTLELLEHLEHQSETPCRRLLSLDPESQDTYVFGRVPLQTTTNVNLELDDQVSSEHATIFSENSEFFIKDLSSLNGTKVNIQSLRAGETIHLSPGDMIAVGNTYMSFAPHLSSSPVSLHAAAMLLLGTHQKKRRGGDGEDPEDPDRDRDLAASAEEEDNKTSHRSHRIMRTLVKRATHLIKKEVDHQQNMQRRVAGRRRKICFHPGTIILHDEKKNLL